MASKKYDKNWNLIGHLSDDGKILYDKDFKVVGRMSDDGKTIYDDEWKITGHLSDDGRTIYDSKWKVSGHISRDGKTVYDEHWDKVEQSDVSNRMKYNREVIFEKTSGSQEGRWAVWLIGAIIVLVILYIIFVVIVPFVILNLSIVALIISIFKKSRKNLFLWISLCGLIYLFIDLQMALLSNHLIQNIRINPETFDLIFYINLIAGFISTFLIVRPIIKSKLIEASITTDSVAKVRISKSNMYDLYIAGGLIVIVATMIFIYNNTFKVKYSSNDRFTQNTNQANVESSTDLSSNIKNESLDPSISEINANNEEANWVITKDLIVYPDGTPTSSTLATIINGLESYSSEGSRVTKAEFLSLFDRSESRIVYTDRLIRYATPKSLDIQKKEHEDYTKIFMQEKRQLAGIEFLKKNNGLLTQVENEYGILKKDMVSLLMWESGLGEFTGDYQIFNVFMAQILFLEKAQEFAVNEIVTKGEENPLLDPKRKAAEDKRLERRKNDAAKNLVSLIRECKASGLDPLLQKGSWGGAIGYVQFMPYNLKYAIDADNNGVKDLKSWPDAMLSAANYLKNVGEYNSSESGRKRALRRYNPSDSYVSGVMLYADTIWERYQKGN